MDGWLIISGNSVVVIILGVVIRAWLGGVEKRFDKKMVEMNKQWSEHCKLVSNNVCAMVGRLEKGQETLEKRKLEDKRELFEALNGHGHKGLEGDNNRVTRKT